MLTEYDLRSYIAVMECEVEALDRGADPFTEAGQMMLVQVLSEHGLTVSERHDVVDAELRKEFFAAGRRLTEHTVRAGSAAAIAFAKEKLAALTAPFEV